MNFEKSDWAIVLLILFILSILFGMLIGHLTYDKVKVHEYNICIDRFEICKERFNNECLISNGAWNYENFEINLSSYQNNNS